MHELIIIHLIFTGAIEFFLALQVCFLIHSDVLRDVLVYKIKRMTQQQNKTFMNELFFSSQTEGTHSLI